MTASNSPRTAPPRSGVEGNPPVPGNLRTLAELIKDVRVAMMTTVAGRGSGDEPRDISATVHTRPMYTQKLDPESFDGELWFMTSAASRKVHEIDEKRGGDTNVLITYADAGSNHYAVINGTATAEHNPEMAQELWNIHTKGWWPEGPASPDLMLIRVRIHTAEYWDGPSNASYMLNLAKAVLTGTRVQTTSGEHGVIREQS